MSFATTEPGSDPIIVEATLPVAPERVFRAWTEPEEVKKWFGSTPGALESAVIDLRVGGRWCFTESTWSSGAVGFEGHYMQIERDALLAFSWSKFSDRGSGERHTTHPSRVEIHFQAVNGNTEMRLVHSAVVDPKIWTDFANGWERAIRSLAAVV